MPKKLWEPQKAVYSEWLKTLTKEEYDQHLLERKHKKSMRKAMDEVIQGQQERWLSLINNALVSVIKRAEEEGDPSALIAVYDRIVGKPDTAIDITSGGKELQAPTLIFQNAEITDWIEVDKNEQIK